MALNVDSFLANDESVVSQYKSKKQTFYATDRRLIWTLRGNFLDASYNHVNTIGMTEIKHKVLIVLGAILFLLGIGTASLGATGGGIFLLVVGLILIILYFVYKHSEYSISLSSGEKIYVPRTKSGNAENFIKAIRDKIR